MFEQRDQALKAKLPNIELILFGDSILQGFDANRFGGSAKYILNSAIGGDSLDFMYKRLNQDVLAYEPQQVLFLGGINNIRSWYSENRQVTEIEEITNEVATKYQLVVDKLIESGVKVYPCTIILNAEDKNNYPFLNLVISSINQKLINYFNSNQLDYVDFNQVLANKYGFLSRDLTDDGLHPNDYGNFEMYQVLTKKGIL